MTACAGKAGYGCEACAESPRLVVVHLVVACGDVCDVCAQLPKERDIVVLQPRHRRRRLLKACFTGCLAHAANDSARACMNFFAYVDFALLLCREAWNPVHVVWSA